MNRIVLAVVTIFVAFLGIACGAANSATHAGAADAETRLQWERNRHEHLAKATLVTTRHPAPEMSELPMPGMPMIPGAGTVLPPGVVGVQQGFIPQLPPPNVFQLHRKVPGCAQPNDIEIHNESPYYVQFNLDGVGIRVFGPDGEMGIPQADGSLLAVVPPGTRAYGCLERLGDVHVNGTAYNNLGGMLSPVGRFDLQRRFTDSTVRLGGAQLLPFTAKTLRWNKVR